MSQCSYVGPSGNRCSEPALDEGAPCFWHDRDADKGGPDIKPQLEAKAKSQQSMEGYELGHADLNDAYLIEADLSYANLSRVDLREGHCFGINLTGTRMFKANLENANLKEARIEGADLLGANLNNTDLERVHWGPKSLIRNDVDAQKLDADGDQVGARAKFLESEEIYRSIRKAYEAAGTTDIAGDFFHREMVAKRKQMPLCSFPRFWSKLVDLLCGYGEIPYRVIGSSFLYILFNSLVFCLLGMQYNGEVYAFDLDLAFLDNLTVFGYGLYYSVVTFTTLGYGDFTPVGWSRPFAAVLAFNGAFMIALFILAFVKKMTR